MEVSVRCSTPQETNITISLTMPLQNWKKLKEEITSRQWPVNLLINAISDAVLKMERLYTVDLSTGEE